MKRGNIKKRTARKTAAKPSCCSRVLLILFILVAVFIFFAMGYSMFKYTGEAILGSYIVSSKTNPTDYTTKGYLNMSTIPKKANLYIDNLYVGKTPKLKTLSSGTHEYSIKLTGYKEFTGEIVISKGKTKYVTAVLQKEE
ncbi:PEGA domain-containing protein [archaeon]|nr:PEGA domain-containing protein [archaeon]